jgi:signal transduction histidine kinase
MRTVAQMQRLTPTSSYASAVAAVAACAVVRWLLNPLLENEGLYLAFMIPVAASAYLGGAGPGSLSAVLSAAIASPYFVQFPAADASASVTHLLLFGIEAGAVVALMQRLRDSRRCAEEALARANMARQVAADAIRAREEFMARVSHDWRGPLNAIAGWLYQLEHRSADASLVQRATASMKRAVESQNRFVSDLLDFSRSAQGKLSLEPQPVPICEPVKRTMEATGAAAAQHRVTIHISEHDSDVRVWGDPVRLQQVFTNLLENATKFTPPGGNVAIDFVTSGDTLEVKVRTRGWESRQTSCQGSSSHLCSHRALGMRNRAASGWDCRSRRTSSIFMVGRCSPRAAGWEQERRLRCDCRWPWRRERRRSAVRNRPGRVIDARKGNRGIASGSYLSSLCGKRTSAATLAPFSAARQPGSSAPIPPIDIVAKVNDTVTVDPRGEVQQMHWDRGV